MFFLVSEKKSETNYEIQWLGGGNSKIFHIFTPIPSGFQMIQVGRLNPSSWVPFRNRTIFCRWRWRCWWPSGGDGELKTCDKKNSKVAKGHLQLGVDFLEVRAWIIWYIYIIYYNIQTPCN